MKYLVVIFLFPFNSFSQSVSFKEIKLTPGHEYYNTKDSTIIFPVIVFGNKSISNNINSILQQTIIDNYNHNKTLQQNLADFVKEERIMNLSYQVTLNRKILSINISVEAYKAYITSSNLYLNFDLITGKKLFIQDIIQRNKLDSFSKIVHQDKTRFLAKYKEQKTSEFYDSTDLEIRDWAMVIVESDCIKKTSINNFYLTRDSILIINPCEFPHAIQSQQPIYELKYSLHQIKGFLNPKVKLD